MKKIQVAHEVKIGVKDIFNTSIKTVNKKQKGWMMFAASKKEQKDLAKDK